MYFPLRWGKTGEKVELWIKAKTEGNNWNFPKVSQCSSRIQTITLSIIVSHYSSDETDEMAGPWNPDGMTQWNPDWNPCINCPLN